MLSNNENILVIVIWIIFFILYILLLGDNSLHKLLGISFISMAVVKSIYDIKNKTGNKKMYVYSEATNQKLRYVAFIVIFIVWVIAHYFLLCTKLNFC